MEKSHFLIGYKDLNALRIASDKVLLERLSSGEYYLFRILVNCMNKGNIIPIANFSFRRFENYIFDFVKLKINRRTIRFNIEKLIDMGLVIISKDCLYINPIVYPYSSRVNDDVYEMFKYLDISLDFIDIFDEIKGLNNRTTDVDEHYIYLLLFESADDSFLKIGITKNSVEKRFSKNQKPYTFQTLLFLKMPDAMSTELKVKRRFDTYKPKVDILRNNGSSECFHIKDRNAIVEIIMNDMFKPISHLQN